MVLSPGILLGADSGSWLSVRLNKTSDGKGHHRPLTASFPDQITKVSLICKHRPTLAWWGSGMDERTFLERYWNISWTAGYLRTLRLSLPIPTINRTWFLQYYGAIPGPIVRSETPQLTGSVPNKIALPLHTSHRLGGPQATCTPDQLAIEWNSPQSWHSNSKKVLITWSSEIILDPHFYSWGKSILKKHWLNLKTAKDGR